MHPFEIATPGDSSEAIQAVTGKPGAKYIAGGTTLVDLLKLDVETPDTLVDITRLARQEPALGEVQILPDGGIRIGALVKNSDLAWVTAVAKRFPVLSQALLSGASGQIRNMATVGGNLMQRTRCYYFRDIAMPCNKRQPGSGCSALTGPNRIHAVLGTSRLCIATHPSDMAVALVALDARVQLRDAGGNRSVPLTQFHTLPGLHPELETVLKPGELIVGVEIPPLSYGSRSLYLKVRDRASYAFALASAAVALDLRGGRIAAARVALGGVGTRPWRSPEAEKLLTGAPANEATYRRAAEAALRQAVPQRDNAFKIELAKRTLVRALNMVERLA